MIKMEGEAARQHIAQMTHYQSLPKPRAVDAVQVNEDFVVVQDGDAAITGAQYCKAGSWLVRSPQGTLYAVPDGVFQSQYSEAVYEQVDGVIRT